MTSQRPTSEFNDHRTMSVIESISQASSPELALEAFEKALAGVGGEYLAVIFLPRPGESIEDVCLAWKVPAEWRAHYSSENMFQRDPAVRYSFRTVMPFDWESAPYDPETERDWAEVLERGRDFGIQNGLAIPVPSPSGMIGAVWVGGRHFDEREVHKPLLHSLGLHVFHRLEQLGGRRLHRNARLTGREREVLAGASEGKTAWEIGCILNLPHRTVEWHFRQAYKKLGAINRLQALAILGDLRTMLYPAIEETPD
jgi:LuxR family transcriptional regulator, quorum-sensing system regulator BjaR1